MKKFEARLGLGSVIAVSLGAMMGSGIFVLPGLAVALTGPSVWLAYFAAAVCILPAALSKSELATAMPSSGGTYVYIERTYGPLAGTVAGLGLYFSLLFKAAFALVGFGAYLTVFAEFKEVTSFVTIDGATIQLMALILLSLIVGMNVLGVGKVSSFLVFIVLLSLTSLFGIAGISLPLLNKDFMEPFFTGGNGGFFAATALVFVSYAGVTKVAAIAEEIRSPEKNLSRGILMSLLIATTLYCGVSFVMAGVIPIEEFSRNLKPVFTLANMAGGEMVGLAAAVVAILTMTSMANAGILAASRFPFAMARDSLLPHLFGQINGRFLTPIWSIVASGVIVGTAILLIDVEKIAKLASAFMILIFVFVNITVIVLRETRVQWYKPRFKSPMYPWIQAFGIISGVTLLMAMGQIVILAIFAISIPGVLLYILFSQKRTDRRGVLGIRWPRRDLVDEEKAVAPWRRYLEEVDLSEDARVVVALFGKERAPEVLTEMGLTIAGENKLEVVHVTEVPEQTGLEDMSEDTTQVRALRRRVEHMSVRHRANVSFDPIVSHDIMKSVSEISQRLHCHWLVVEWGGKTRGALTLHDPIGWLRDHLSCHLLTFSDKGVRYFRKILVIVNSDRSNDLLLETADYLAQANQAEITLLSYVKPEADQEVIDCEVDLLNSMCNRCQSAEEAIVLSGKNELETYVRATEDFDLLIFEQEKVGSQRQRFFGSLHDKLMERSSCSVIGIRRSHGNQKIAPLKAGKQIQIIFQRRLKKFSGVKVVSGKATPKIDQ